MTEALTNYLVRPREPRTLAQVLASIEADPSMQIVHRLGPPDAPHTLVVSMIDSQAAALRQRFAGQLIVERDQPLSLYPA